MSSKSPSRRASEDTFTIFEIQTCLPNFIMWTSRFGNLTASPEWTEKNCDSGNKKIFIYWQAAKILNNCLGKIGK